MKIFTLILSLACVCSAFGKETPKSGGYPITPVPFTSVKIHDGFIGNRMMASRQTTIPLAFSKCEESGRYQNFIKAANPSDKYEVRGYPFDDTDVYKTIEGASYLLQTYPDPEMEAYIDSVLTIVAAAQEPDGYLNTSFTMNPKHPHPWMGPGRWDSVENLSHEFYNLGHMVEGAVAHYQATGNRKFLDIAIKYADCVCREIGDNPGQVKKVPGHQIAEMALARLYLVTGDKKYLDQAKYFLDTRGKTTRKDAYSQAHLPVVEQDEAVGHAVRAVYMYSGMADVAALTGDSAYIKAIDRIWDNIVGKKYYITGGIGATHAGEAFGKNYELPNLSAYCETCAAIGNVYMNHRLFLLHGDAKYYDVVERTLYNGVLSGVALDGGSFFYPNPLQSNGGYKRQPWFGCACCPSNLSRFIPSLPGYIYAVRDRDLFVNMFTQNSAKIEIEGKSVELTQTGGYPWNGDVDITIDKNRAGRFTLKIRIPGWAVNHPVPSDLYTYLDPVKPDYTVSVNGQQVTAELNNGYFSIDRKWKAGDKISISFKMEPRFVVANPKVEADRGRVAVERGPIVYCIEDVDNPLNPQSVLINTKNIPTVKKSDILGGIIQLMVPAQQFAYDRTGNISVRNVDLTLIPYFTWANRGDSRMTVWIPASLDAVTPEGMKINVTNNESFSRTGEIVEIPKSKVGATIGNNFFTVSQKADGSRNFIILDNKGKEVPWQKTHDGKIIFPADVDANSTTSYLLIPGTPAPVDTICYGQLFPWRKDDMTWENDRSAYRAYGPALQKSGEKAYGYDIWTKNVPYPVIVKRYRDHANGISFHEDHGEGMDVYSVGPTLGGGTPALLDNNGEIIYPYAWKEYQILDNGPLRFTVKLTYNPSKINNDESVVETRVITLDAGSWLNKSVITYNGLKNPTTFSPGIVIHRQSPEAYTLDSDYGFISYIDPTDNQEKGNGEIFVGIVSPTADNLIYKPLGKPAGDAIGHILAQTQSVTNKPQTYYFGSGWSKGGIKDGEEWNNYLRKFSRCVSSPLVVTVE